MNDKVKAIITLLGGAFGVEDNSSSYVAISREGMFWRKPTREGKNEG